MQPAETHTVGGNRGEEPEQKYEEVSSMKKKGYVEMRYYDVPQKEWVLALLGQEWVRAYGEGIRYLHFHNLFELGICREGTGVLVLDRKNCPYHPGMISLIPKNYPHTTTSTEGTQSAWEYLFFEPETILGSVFGENRLQISRCMAALSSGALFGEVGTFKTLTETANLIMDEMRRRERYYIERVHGLMTALLFELLRICNSEEGRAGENGGRNQIQNALQYMDSHYAEHIRIDDLAKACSISETHFRRLFSESFSISPGEYLNMIRVIHACELMRSCNEPMTAVAVKSGFQTVSTLDRNFRNVLGVTPYQWKKDPKNYESRLLEVNVAIRKGW